MRNGIGVLLGEHLGRDHQRALALPSTAASRAATATIVLPDPTSPWSSRCIGSSFGQVREDLAMARRWAPVGS